MDNANRNELAIDATETEFDMSSEEIMLGKNPTKTGEDAITDDALMALAVNNEEQEEIRKRRVHPGGDYKKFNSVWKVRKVVRAGDSQPGDIFPEGRTSWVITGLPQIRLDKVGNEHAPQLTIWVSPDKRYSPRNPANNDGSTNNFNQARDMYIRVKGEKPNNIGDIIRFLRDDDYLINTFPGNDGNLAVGSIKVIPTPKDNR